MKTCCTVSSCLCEITRAFETDINPRNADLDDLKQSLLITCLSRISPLQMNPTLDQTLGVPAIPRSCLAISDLSPIPSELILVA